MTLLRAVRPEAGAAAVVFLFAVLCSTVVRLALAFEVASVSPADDPTAFLAVMALGFVHDVLVAACLAAPLVAFLAVPHRLWRLAPLRWAAHALLAGGLTALAFAVPAEILFWDEFAGRFNGIAVYYLLFPREVIGNVRESFDLALGLPAVAAVGLAVWLVGRRRFAVALAAEPRPWRRRLALGVALAVPAAATAALVAMPRPDLGNRELDQLARNGLASLAAAAATNDAEYDGVYPGMPEAEAVRLARAVLRQDNTAFLDGPEGSSLARRVDNGSSPKRLNIVIAIEESFGSRFVDTIDNRSGESISPHLDRLARDGLFFTNVYASGDRTVRGLEAVLTAFQPIPGISTARRPGSQGMNSLPFLLRAEGYRTAMLYGGRALFDNMGAFWKGIGFDEVWDQSDIREPGFTTIWGVADEYLFGEALRRIDEGALGGGPFMLSLLTVSNHPPKTYPEGRIAKSPARKRIENSATYADWAFGRFVEQARTRPWFDDTVFVFVGDHSVKINGAAEIPLHGFRIPLLIYAPKHIAPARVATLGAQIDLIPTLLGRLGFSYESPFFGIDLMRVPPGGGRIAVAHNFSVAYARPGHAVVLEPDGGVKGYSFAPGDPTLGPEAPDPATLAEAIALTQTAHHMFYGRRYHDMRDRLRPVAEAR